MGNVHANLFGGIVKKVKLLTTQVGYAMVSRNTWIRIIMQYTAHH